MSSILFSPCLNLVCGWSSVSVSLCVCVFFSLQLVRMAISATLETDEQLQCLYTPNEWRNTSVSLMGMSHLLLLFLIHSFTQSVFLSFSTLFSLRAYRFVEKAVPSWLFLYICEPVSNLFISLGGYISLLSMCLSISLQSIHPHSLPSIYLLSFTVFVSSASLSSTYLSIHLSIYLYRSSIYLSSFLRLMCLRIRL